jgi:hypothetical protein
MAKPLPKLAWEAHTVTWVHHRVLTPFALLIFRASVCASKCSLRMNYNRGHQYNAHVRQTVSNTVSLAHGLPAMSGA